jgi:hypothetical protein
MLEDDDAIAPSIEAAAVPALVAADVVSVNTSIVSSTNLGKPADTRWYDVEKECYVFDDCPPSPPKEDGTAPVLDQDLRYLSGLLESPVNLPKNRDTFCVSEQLEADTLPRTLDEDMGQNCRENLSSPEGDMLVDGKAQEPVLLAAAPGSPRPLPPSSDMAHPLVDQEPDHIGTTLDGFGELRNGHSSRTQVEEGGPQGGQHQTAAVDALMAARDSGGEFERGEARANCHRQDDRAQSSSGCGHDTNDKGHLGEDDNSEESRPTKRRKRDSQPGHNRNSSPSPVLETTDLEKPRGCILDMDTSEEWEIDSIAGRKMVSGEKHYLAVWIATWMRESDLAGARELIDEFESALP